MGKHFKKYPSIITASQNRIDDVDFFNIPHAYAQRIKRYIVEYDPELLPEKSEDYIDYYDETEYDYFLNADDALAQIFDTREQLANYVADAVAHAEGRTKTRLESVVNYFNR